MRLHMRSLLVLVMLVSLFSLSALGQKTKLKTKTFFVYSGSYRADKYSRVFLRIQVFPNTQKAVIYQEDKENESALKDSTWYRTGDTGLEGNFASNDVDDIIGFEISPDGKKMTVEFGGITPHEETLKPETSAQRCVAGMKAAYSSGKTDWGGPAFGI
jgi:hypothetical protein